MVFVSMLSTCILLIGAVASSVSSSCPHSHLGNGPNPSRHKRSLGFDNFFGPSFDLFPRQVSRNSFSGPVDQLTDLLLRGEAEARRQVDEAERLEQFIYENGASSPVPNQFVIVAAALDDATRSANRAFVMEAVSRFVANETGDVIGLERISLRGTPLEYLCDPILKCSNIQYRSTNGSCNNLLNTNWGQAFGAVNRFLPHVYPDGINAIRGSDHPLPSPRLVSTSVFSADSLPFTGVNQFWTAWGQVITHDVVGTPAPLGPVNSIFQCCSPKVLKFPQLLHPECAAISIPRDDPFYSQFGERCMQFVRSPGAPRPDCTLGPRMHVTTRSPIMDSSHIYGNEDDSAVILRSFSGGRLKSNIVNGGEAPLHDDGAFFPFQLPDSACFKTQPDPEAVCPVTGDFIMSEQPQLTMFATLFLRWHNNLADQLGRLNPHWDDERLYQETRRIVNAQYQYLTYKEYLPILLGTFTMNQYGLNVLEEGHSFDYDPHVNPTTVDEFGVFVFRMGHTSAPDVLNIVERGSAVRTVNLHEVASRPFNMTRLDGYIVGGLLSETLAPDNTATLELSTQLIVRRSPPGGRDFPFGLDLIAVNIQRGREHGIGPYNDYREFCGFPRARNFRDLTNWMSIDAVKRLQSVYRHVDDIDPFPGVMSETPIPGAAVGPVLACLAAEQFRRYKVGDRFWFENANLPNSFSADQVNQIRQFSLARLFCDYSDSLESALVNAFLLPSDENPIVRCNDPRIPRMNLLPWKERF